MASVYILFSDKHNKLFSGSCLDLEARLIDHKNKTFLNSFTANADDWELYFSINELHHSDARKIETHMKSKKYIENLKKYPEMVERLIQKFSIEP